MESREPTKPLPTSRPAMEIKTVDEPIIAPRAALPIAMKEGQLPLFYLCDSGGDIRVTDRSANVELAGEKVSPGAIVSVDERQGVRIADKTLVAGPLDASHVYTIYLLPESQNVLQHGTLRPKSAQPSQ